MYRGADKKGNQRMKSKLVGNIWWKAVVCGMAMATFTGAVGMAEDIEAKPKITFIEQQGMPVDMPAGMPVPVGDHYTDSSLLAKGEGTEYTEPYVY